MRPFKQRFQFLKTRLGLKFLMVFVCCSLFPILILSSVTYTLVGHQLEDEAKNQLQRAAKSYGLTIYDHLVLVDAQLKLLLSASLTPKNNPTGMAELFDNSLKENFKSIIWFESGKETYPIFGQMESIPALPSQIWPHLAMGKSALITYPYSGAQGHRVFMVRGVSNKELKQKAIIAEINSEFLWALGDANPLPFKTEFCVLDENNNILISTIPFLDPKLEQLLNTLAGSIYGQYDSDAFGKEHIVTGWTLFLKPRFLTKGWKIILFQSNAQIRQPVYEFRRTFLLSSLLTFWIILLFSIRFIRKSLIPLEKIIEGTKRILKGEFNTPVEYHSGDEFDDLISSFNHMSFELGRQVQSLRVVAKIGRETAGISDPRRLLEVELSILEDALKFKRILILLADSKQRRLKCEAWYGFKGEAVESFLKVDIPIEDGLDDDAIVKAFHRKESLWWRPSSEPDQKFLQSDKLLQQFSDATTLFCVPIVYEEHSLGVMIVDGAGGQPLSESEEALIKGIAAYTASGIYNALSSKKLKSSEERFRRIFDNAAAGMILIDVTGHIVKANSRFGEMLGYNLKQIEDLKWQDLSHPDDIDLTSKIVKRLQTGQRQSELYEKRFLHQNGRSVPALISTSLLRDEMGEPLYYISQIQDLSQQKAAEEERKKIERQLMQSQKMEAMGTLAGGIAHDFNNIISAMLGQAELGVLQIEQSNKARERFEGILQAAHRAKGLVNQILTFSRQSDHKKQTVSICQIIKETTELLKATLPANITIKANINIKNDTVFADPNQIHQVIMNLSTNAYHAMGEKGGILSVELETILIDALNTIEYVGLGKGRYVKVSIRDTGCGISPEHIKRIFDPYFTTKEKGKGTGLGLALVHGIIKDHRGAIYVDSREGQGTTFEIVLPYFQQAEYVPEKVPPQRIEGGQGRILFVDDEPILIELGTEMLTHLGYEVESYLNSADALAQLKLRPESYDLVITDFNMPHMNGDLLALEVEALRPDLPVILCSGYQEWNESKQHLPKVLKTILPKPFTLSELALAVSKILN
jgi:PAS domain S-box-containing protein